MQDPLDLPLPRSAWVLFGDEASYLSNEELREQNTGAPPGWQIWTASPHVEAGDLLFIYFIAPRSAIHFVARATSHPYVDAGIGVNANREVTSHQWRVPYNGIVEIRPITYRRLCMLSGERLILKGRSGKYIRPQVANRLLQEIEIVNAPFEWCAKLYDCSVVGASSLPSPDKIGLKDLREIPSSLLRLEAEVERYVVEPLLRLSRAVGKRYCLKRRLRIGRKMADYAVMQGDHVKCIIEVKLRTRLDRQRNWSGCPDLEQASWYAGKVQTPFVIVDCEQIFCFRPSGKIPCLKIDRHRLKTKDLTAFRAHVLGV